ncbi:hypothetical protein [Streptomyces sp. WG7]|uniref:hypothetical protein n=1 Tax=Streptomyces sp. WG7 TaxID=3417650 RepID=UPI003CF1AB47
MARVGVAVVQLLPFSGITHPVSGPRAASTLLPGRKAARSGALPAGPGHAYRRRRRPGAASSSPYDPGSRRNHG